MAADSRNYLLASFAPADFALLEPHLERVTLGLRKHLEKGEQANRASCTEPYNKSNGSPGTCA
jgi:hypothetical protein